MKNKKCYSFNFGPPPPPIPSPNKIRVMKITPLKPFFKLKVLVSGPINVFNLFIRRPSLENGMQRNTLQTIKYQTAQLISTRSQQNYPLSLPLITDVNRNQVDLQQGVQSKTTDYNNITKKCKSFHQRLTLEKNKPVYILDEINWAIFLGLLVREHRCRYVAPRCCHVYCRPITYIATTSH